MKRKMVHIGIFWMLGLFFASFFSWQWCLLLSGAVVTGLICCCIWKILPDFSRDNRRLLAVGRACTFLELHHAGGAACFAI